MQWRNCVHFATQHKIRIQLNMHDGSTDSAVVSEIIISWNIVRN